MNFEIQNVLNIQFSSWKGTAAKSTHNFNFIIYVTTSTIGLGDTVIVTPPPPPPPPINIGFKTGLIRESLELLPLVLQFTGVIHIRIPIFYISYIYFISVIMDTVQNSHCFYS